MLSKSPLPSHPTSWRLTERLPEAQAAAQTSAAIRSFAPLLRSEGLQSCNGFNRNGVFARLDLDFSDGTLTVCLDCQDDAALTALLSDEDSAQRCALAQLLLDQALIPLGSFGLGSVHVSQISAWQGPLPFPARPHFQLNTVESVYSVLLARADQSLMVTAQALAGRSHWQHSWVRALKLAAFPCIATQRYQADRLASLRPGDVLLAPITFRANTYAMSLRCGDGQGFFWQAEGHGKAQQFSIEHVRYMTTESITHAPANALAQLDVPVQLELDPIVLSMGQLEDLAPGHVLELASGVDSASIRLMVYGQEIGHGKLVAVGDHLGIQIAGVAGSTHGND